MISIWYNKTGNVNEPEQVVIHDIYYGEELKELEKLGDLIAFKAQFDGHELDHASRMFPAFFPAGIRVNIICPTKKRRVAILYGDIARTVLANF